MFPWSGCFEDHDSRSHIPVWRRYARLFHVAFPVLELWPFELAGAFPQAGHLFLSQRPELLRDPNVIFDRCPADILGYLLSHIDAEAFDLEKWLPRVRTAVRKLDLVVFLPIEEPDRIVLPLSQDAAYRRRVDEKLKEILLDNSFDLEVDVLEVTGSPQMRVEQVLSHIRKKSA